METFDSIKESGDSSVNGAIDALSRRDIMKRSALLTAGGTLGLGTVGLAGASSQCTDSKNLSEDNNYNWERPYEHKQQEACGGHSYEQKVHLGSNLAHKNTWRPDGGDRWYHTFETVGHSESYWAEGRNCDGPWNLNYVLKQKASFINELTNSTNNTVSTGSDVKANPPLGSNTEDDKYLDLAYTLLASAIGEASWPVGTAMSLVAAAQSNDQGAEKNDETVEYLWDYTTTADKSPPCATNAVFHEFRSHRGADDHVKFTHYQEAWGDNGTGDIYIGTKYTVDMQDPGTSSSSVSTSSSDTSVESSSNNSSEQSGWPTQVEKGNTIRDTENNKIKVKKVGTDKQYVPGTPPKKVTASDISSRAAEKFGPDHPVVQRQLPTQIEVTMVGGIVKE